MAASDDASGERPGAGTGEMGPERATGRRRFDELAPEIEPFRLGRSPGRVSAPRPSAGVASRALAFGCLSVVVAVNVLAFGALAFLIDRLHTRMDYVEMRIVEIHHRVRELSQRQLPIPTTDKPADSDTAPAE